MEWTAVELIVFLPVVAFAVAIYLLPSGGQGCPGDWPPEVKRRAQLSQASRALVRRQHRKLFEDLRDCFFKHDPIGINFATNTDEYDPEVGTVIPRLSACTSQADVLDVLHEEFVSWFGAAIAGPKSRYSRLSAEVWAIWRRGEARPPDGSAAAGDSEGREG